jgi:hypothetical protein
MTPERNPGTEAVIPARERGANGIPDLPVETDVVKQPSEDVVNADARSLPAASSTREPQMSWLALIAVGAIAIGTVGAIAGLWQSSRRRRPVSLGAVPDPHALTPPHGDKLMPRR